jgi:hypothetical protein
MRQSGLHVKPQIPRILSPLEMTRFILFRKVSSSLSCTGSQDPSRLEDEDTMTFQLAYETPRRLARIK